MLSTENSIISASSSKCNAVYVTDNNVQTVFSFFFILLFGIFTSFLLSLIVDYIKLSVFLKFYSFYKLLFSFIRQFCWLKTLNNLFFFSFISYNVSLKLFFLFRLAARYSAHYTTLPLCISDINITLFFFFLYPTHTEEIVH